MGSPKVRWCFSPNSSMLRTASSRFAWPVAVGVVWTAASSARERRNASNGMPLEAFLLSLAEEAAVQTTPTATGQAKREEAVRSMLEFGEKHHLTFGEPITRALLHEGHRH